MPNLLEITHHNACEYLSNPLLHEAVIAGTIQNNKYQCVVCVVCARIFAQLATRAQARVQLYFVRALYLIATSPSLCCLIRGPEGRSQVCRRFECTIHLPRSIT